MTGKWENALNKVGEGKIPASVFNKEIRNYTVKCTEELMTGKLDKSEMSKRADATLEFLCPKCGGRFLATDKICKCNNQDCGFFFWRVVCQRRLTEKDIKDILQLGHTREKVKLKKKDGKTFEARLKLEPDGKFTFK